MLRRQRMTRVCMVLGFLLGYPLLYEYMRPQERCTPPIDKMTMKKRLPQAYIIGQMKCGTGTLRKFLSEHPYIVVPDRVETSFMARTKNSKPLVKRTEQHRDMMPESGPQHITLENAPVYFSNPVALTTMAQTYSKESLIVILCDPAVRVMSHFLQQRRNYKQKLNQTVNDFLRTVIKPDGSVNEKTIEITVGVYIKDMKRWMAKLPKARIEVVDGKQFIKDPTTVLQRLEKVLGIPSYFKDSMFILNKDKTFYCLKETSGEAECMPDTKGRQHPVIPEDVEIKLRDFYKPFDEELFNLIGRELSWKQS